MNKIVKIIRAVAHKFVKLEQPFHLIYLGPAAQYYYEHNILPVAFGAGALFAVTAVDLIIELFDTHA